MHGTVERDMETLYGKHNRAIHIQRTANAMGRQRANVAVQVAAGSNTVVLRRDGSVKGYGTTGFGQINFPRNLPPAVAVGSGEGFSTALLYDGTQDKLLNAQLFFVCRPVPVRPLFGTSHYYSQREHIEQMS
jgi:hypothetical protein